MTIRWALLGPGRHATRNVLPQIKSAADTELVAVVSRDRDRAESLAHEHGIAKAYTTLDEALGDPGIDAVYDATPDALHADHAVACAQAGKHALIEKPLAVSVAECARAIEAAKRAGTKLGVVYQQRHDNAHVEARRMIAAGAIGDTVLAHAFLPMRILGRAAPPAGGNWRADPKMRPGGVAMTIADHAHDTLTWILGREIVEVAAMTDATRTDPPNERVASLLLKLSGGAVATAEASYRTPFGRRPIEVHGTTGSIVLSNSFAGLLGADGDPTLELVTESGTQARKFPPSACYRVEFETFAKGAPATDAADGLRVLAVTEAIYESVRTGRAVKVN